MIKRFGGPVILFTVAFLILFISVFRASRVRYVFSAPIATTEEAEVAIPYDLPDSDILPDNPFWPFAALADRIWLIVGDSSERSRRELSLADERLVQAVKLFEKEDCEHAVSVLTKAEKYLESSHYDLNEAYKKGELDSEDMQRFLLATLKHREVIEDILFSAPEDARSVIVITLNVPKTLYEKTKAMAIETGLPAPTNPFEI